MLSGGRAQLGLFPDMLEAVSLGRELVALLWRAASFSSLSGARWECESRCSVTSDERATTQHAASGGRRVATLSHSAVTRAAATIDSAAGHIRSKDSQDGGVYTPPFLLVRVLNGDN